MNHPVQKRLANRWPYLYQWENKLHLFDLLAGVLVDPVGGPDVVAVGAVEAVRAVIGVGSARVEAVQHHVHRRADELHVDDCSWGRNKCNGRSNWI